jgi:putative transposase
MPGLGTPPEQRCWVHKVRNVLGALRHSVHPAPRRALNQILAAEDRSHAERAIQAFAAEFGVKWPKAVAKVVNDADSSLSFYDYPAEHWLHLRTTKPIESTFAPLRARTKLSKGPGNAAAGLAMVLRLPEAAEQPWRKVNGPRLIALVRPGALFERGQLVSGPRGR